MCRALRSFSSFSCCYSVLGFVVICCLHTEVFSHTPRWPAGKYGLPMAMSGCPKADGFSWDTGYIYQDLEDDRCRTTASSSFHLQAEVKSSGDVRRSFCMKTNRSSATDFGRSKWPFGQYCIYKKGSACPKGLQEGWVLWDDENGKDGVNLNFQSGSVPNGNYNQDTKIYFCCQTVGSSSTPVELPIDKPFYLIAFNNKQCQEVLKAIHTMEFIRYDTENTNNHDKQNYPYPYSADLQLPYIYYCYYQACRWTKTALKGTFWSPNYPNTYKNHAWCEWRIEVPTNYIISLTFEDFKLEYIGPCMTPTCECDYVEVQETLSDGTSALIGKYCMGAAYPKGDIRTRGNNMTVIFRSDYLIGESGFKARYEAIQVTVPTSVASTTTATNNTKPTGTSAAIQTTVLSTQSTSIPSPTSGKDISTSFPKTTSDKWATTTAQPSPGTNSSGTPTSRITTLFTKQNRASTFATDEPTATGPLEPSKQTTTKQDLPSAESSTVIEATNNATIKAGVHQARNEKPGTGNVNTIIAVTVSLITIGGIVGIAVACFCRKRNPQSKIKQRDSLTVNFTAAENNYGISNMITCNMYAGSDENEEKDEHYTNITKLQESNILYENRASFADSIDQFVTDDEIKESDNPLYSSSDEADQDNNNVLYESMGDLTLCATEELESSVNPVYEGMV